MHHIQYEWYALHVKSCQERMAQAYLREMGFEDFLPSYRSKRKWSDRIKEIEVPLFPGYIFSRFDARQRARILAIPAVAAIVGVGKKAIPIEEREIESIRILVGSGLPALIWPFMKKGQKILIHTGPLRGTEGRLIEQNHEKRVVVSITLLQRSVAVKVERDWIEPISAPWCPVADTFSLERSARL